MAKYEQTGQIHHVNQRAAQYGDFSNVSDLISAFEQVEGANDLFMELPAETRAFFQNDPFKFVEYCSNPENIEVLREMGLAEPAQEKKAEKPATKKPDDNQEIKKENPSPPAT